MDSNFIIWFALIFLVIIPWIKRQKTIAAVRHILNHKKYKGESSAMKELAEKFIGKECVIYTVTGTDSTIKGTIKEVGDGGIIVERPDGIEAVNLEYITRIREWPRNAKGKKKQIFE